MRGAGECRTVFTGKVHHLDPRVGGTDKMSFTNVTSAGFPPGFAFQVLYDNAAHTVKVKITDNAKIENGTSRSRTNKEDSGVTDFIGSKLLTGDAAKLMPGKILSADSTANSEGKGSVNRQEALLTNLVRRGHAFV